MDEFHFTRDRYSEDHLLNFVEMKNFVVSALKYRPKRFQDVVGQELVTQTLQNALDRNQLPKALLFCGPRGVGKTSCARILAKKVNESSDNQKNEEDFSFNIFELDAASNNSVEDIRRLNQQVRIPPHIGTHKIYIIDEAHMLSTQAFNAFLKTLEEPPKNVIFILATTEKNKIIPTILSRCQVYDFRRISVKEIVGYLSKITEDKNLFYQEDALYLIAQKADGAMRDALSILDRMVSFTNGRLTTKLVAKNLNILDTESYLEIVNNIKSGKTSEVILKYNDLFYSGFDNYEFVLGLGQHLRNILLTKSPKTTNLLDYGENIIDLYQQLAKKIKVTWLLEALQIVHQCELTYKTSHNKQLHIELCLLQLVSLDFVKKPPNKLIPVEDIRNTKSPSIESQIDRTNTGSSSLPSNKEDKPPLENQNHSKTETKTSKENSKQKPPVNPIIPGNESSNGIKTKSAVKKVHSPISQIQTSKTPDKPSFNTPDNLAIPELDTTIGNKKEVEHLVSALDFLSSKTYKGKQKVLNNEGINQFKKDMKSHCNSNPDLSQLAILEKGEFEINHNNLITFSANGSNMIKNKFLKIQPKLELAMKNYFNSQTIRLECTLGIKKPIDKPMSNEEKVKYFIQKNKALEKLIRELNLK